MRLTLYAKLLLVAFAAMILLGFVTPLGSWLAGIAFGLLALAGLGGLHGGPERGTAPELRDASARSVDRQFFLNP